MPLLSFEANRSFLIIAIMSRALCILALTKIEWQEFM